jgi:hypothetical protein
MLELFAIKSAIAIAMKNTVATVVYSIPIALVIASFPEIKVDLVAYGLMGGVTRWVAAKCEWKDGLGGVLVGILMALGFEGASIPFIASLVVGEAQQAHCSSYAYGLVGNIIFDWIVSYVRLKKDKP